MAISLAMGFHFSDHFPLCVRNQEHQNQKQMGEFRRSILSLDRTFEHQNQKQIVGGSRRSILGRLDRTFEQHNQKQIMGGSRRSILDLDRFNHEMNKASKWAMSSILLATIVWRHDRRLVWVITGAFLNGANSRLLKRLINQQRPASAAELNVDEPGMPSTHAQSLAYLSTCAAIAIFQWSGMRFISLFSASAIYVCASYLAWLRVSEGLHTPAQVIVGAMIGGVSASLWSWLWPAFAQNFVRSSPWAWSLIIVYFSLSTLAFVVNEVQKKFRAD